MSDRTVNSYRGFLRRSRGAHLVKPPLRQRSVDPPASGNLETRSFHELRYWLLLLGLVGLILLAGNFWHDANLF